MRDIKKEFYLNKPYVAVLLQKTDDNLPQAQRLEVDYMHDMHINFDGFSHGFLHYYNEKTDLAKNYLLNSAVKSDIKYALLMKGNVALPWDGFFKLHETAEKNPDSIVSALCYSKFDTPMVTVKKGNDIYRPNLDAGQIIEAHEVGLDAVLIPNSILKKIRESDPDIPFTYICPETNELPFISEYSFFSHRLRKLGFRILVNTDVHGVTIDLNTGKYITHQNADIKKYVTNIQLTTRIISEDETDLNRPADNKITEVSSIENKQENQINTTENTETPVGDPVKNTKTLDQLAIQYDSDKNSLHHNYAVKYDKILSPFKDKVEKILEIGVWRGSSLRMWKDYFNKATIYGLDIDPNCAQYEDERIKIIVGDQSKDEDLNRLSSFGPFDVIVDDGCHYYYPQIHSFEMLWKSVKSGGLYIVEDVLTSYLKGFGEGLSAIDYFKNISDCVNFCGSHDNSLERRESLVIPSIKGKTQYPLDILSVSFFNGFIVIEKSTEQH